MLRQEELTHLRGIEEYLATDFDVREFTPAGAFAQPAQRRTATFGEHFNQHGVGVYKLTTLNRRILDHFSFCLRRNGSKVGETALLQFRRPRSKLRLISGVIGSLRSDSTTTARWVVRATCRVLSSDYFKEQLRRPLSVYRRTSPVSSAILFFRYHALTFAQALTQKQTPKVAVAESCGSCGELRTYSKQFGFLSCRYLYTFC